MEDLMFFFQINKFCLSQSIKSFVLRFSSFTVRSWSPVIMSACFNKGRI